MTSDRNICYEHALSIQRDSFWRACVMNDNFRHYSRQVFPVYCEDMADSTGSSSFSPATPGPQSSIDELVSGLLENPHFQDVLERTTRRTHRSPSLQANQPATGSTTSRPVFQTPVEEFRSLFRAGTSSSQGQNT